MDLSVYWVLLWTICVELFLLNASASEDNIHVEEEHYAQLPLYFVDEQTDIVIPLHLPTALQCTVVSSGSDRINITWLKDGIVIVNTTSRWILPDGTLHLEAGEPHTEEGNYECLAKHSIGTIASRRIRLEAPTIPEFMQHPQDLVAFQGESVRLECIVNGTPEAVISWIKDGRPLESNRTRTNTFSGVLQIVNATQQDDGTYECLATNAAGQLRSQAAKVTIRSSSANERLSPKLLAGPVDQTAAVSDKVVLECFLTGRPRPPVSWMQQGGAMFSSVGRVRVTRYGNLEISNVQLSDAGTYICSWMSMDSSETKAYRQARLSVLAPPQLVLTGAMGLYTVRHRRQIVRLKCEFEGVPVPRVVWMKNGQVLEPSGRIRMDEWELIIASSDTSDSGFYQCRGENSVGAFQSTTWVVIEANENAPLPPVDLVVIPLTSTSVRLSWKDHPLNENRSIIAYSIHAFPTRGGLEIQDVRKKEDGSELVWEVFQPFTNYTFYVVAYNVDGGSDHSAYVTAMTTEDVPLESPLMEVTAVGPTGLRLRWSELGPDLARGVIIQYQVLHRCPGNSSYQPNLVNADIREFVIQGLHSETEYEVVVLAGTVKGFPMPDSVSWVTVTTEAAKNTGVPTHTEMNISLVSSNSIVVSWMVDNTLQINRFRLTCRRINQKHHMMPTGDVITDIDLDKYANKYILTELESYAVYQVTLASQNQFGWSDSITRTFRMDAGINGDAKSSQVDVSETDLPNPPTKVFAESINSSAIVVRWEKPAEVKDITRYTVRYRPDLKETVSDISVVKFVTSPVEMVVIGDLSAHTQYDLSVQTHTNNAIGPFSSVVKCRTEEGIPSEPVNIQLTVYSDTAVQVTWNPPAQSNGVIIRYIIYYTTDHRHAMSEWLTKTSSGSSLSSLVSYLKPNTIYYFRLQAATFAEHGPLSDIVHIRTQDPSDLHYHDTTDLPRSSVLSDQDLGIIIGSAIGLTCIVLCVIFIVIRDRRSARHAAPATRTHVANGVVKSCHCHLANGSAAEPWRVVGSEDDDDFPSVNSVLVENENCDTKGGYTQNERQGRNPVRAVARSGMCNGVQHCDRQPSQHAVKVSLSAGNEKAESLEVAASDAGNKGGKLASEQLSSSVPSEQIASCSVTDSDVVDVEPIDTSSNGICGGRKENNEADEDFAISHFNEGDGATESESLMGNSHRTSLCCEVPVGIAGESTSCIEEDASRKTAEEEEEEEMLG